MYLLRDVIKNVITLPNVTKSVYQLCEFSNCLKRWSNRKLMGISESNLFIVCLKGLDKTVQGYINFGRANVFTSVTSTVVKSFALPKLIYPFTVLPDPTKQTINKLDSEIFLFLCNSKIISEYDQEIPQS